MKKFLLVLLFPLSCAAATITGYIIDQTGGPKTGVISIQPLSVPALIGTNYVSGQRFSITLTNGGFTNTLIAGDYLLALGGTDSPRISVPDTNAVFNFIDLINTNGLLYAFKQPGAVVKVSSTDAVFGFLREKLTNAAPLTLAVTTDTNGNQYLTVALPAATSSANGYLSSTDWQTFNAKQPGSANLTNWASLSTNSFPNTARTISTTSPLAGGGDLSANRTLSLPQADNVTHGYLSSNDWQTFNAKQDAGNYQPASANLTNWSALATSAKEDTLGFSPVNKAGDSGIGALALTAALTADSVTGTNGGKFGPLTGTSSTLSSSASISFANWGQWLGGSSSQSWTYNAADVATTSPVTVGRLQFGSTSTNQLTISGTNLFWNGKQVTVAP